ARHVLTPPTEPLDREACNSDECRIESLVQQALPRFPSDSIFSLTAAKLLYFANKAYRLQALGLVEKAMASTTAVANAFAVAGQLQMWEGNINKAIELYAQGLKLTRHGSHFHRYFLVLTMHAELACGAKGSEAAEQLFHIVPDERALLSLLWAPELTTAVRTEIDALVKTMNASAARAI